MRLHPKSAFKPLLLAAALLALSAAGPGSLAGVTSLLVDSEPGEPIGRGEFVFLTPDDGWFFNGGFLIGPSPPSPFPSIPENEVPVLFSGFKVSWSLRFAAPPGEPLTVGVYENAVPVFGRQPGEPGIDVTGNARACFGASGRFEVKQVAFDADGRMISFWATFEHICAGATLRGEVRYDADVPVVLSAPSRRNVLEGRNLRYGVEGFDTDGLPVTLTASALPPGAVFDDSGDGTGIFDWIPGSSQTGFYWVATHGESLIGETDTVYTRIDAIPDFDEFDRAVPFSPPPFPQSTLPFVSRVDNPEASRAGDDPICLDPPWAEDWGTVWYAFTPQEDLRLHGSILATSTLPPGLFPPGSAPEDGAALSVYTGERGALEQLACQHGYARFNAIAGETYYIMAGLPEPEAPMTFLAEQLQNIPPNDDFDDATIITALPFSDAIGAESAIAEHDDPGQCGDGLASPNVWYAYTPSEDTQLRINAAASSYSVPITVFSGMRGALVPVECGISRVSFTALAGETYHVMIAGTIASPGSLLQVVFTDNRRSTSGFRSTPTAGSIPTAVPS